MGILSAEGIVAVAAAEGQLVAGGILPGSHVDIVAAADAGNAEEVVVHLSHTLLVACGIVHTANHAVAETAEFQVVERNTVKVGVAVLAVIASDAESHRAEGVSHLAEIGIFFRRNGAHRLLGIVVLVELALRKGKVSIVDRQGVGRCLRRGTCHKSKKRRHEERTFLHKMNMGIENNCCGKEGKEYLQIAKLKEFSEFYTHSHGLFTLF